MSDLTQYEKDLAEQLKGMPVPDKDSSWIEMKKLLDDDDRKGGALPRSFNRNKIVVGLLALLLLISTTSVLIFNKEKKQSKAISLHGKINAGNNVSKDLAVDITKKPSAIEASNLHADRTETQNKTNSKRTENLKTTNNSSVESNKNIPSFKATTTTANNEGYDNKYKTKDKIELNGANKELRSNPLNILDKQKNNKYLVSNSDAVSFKKALNNDNKKSLLAAHHLKVEKKSRIVTHTTQADAEDAQTDNTTSQKEMILSDNKIIVSKKDEASSLKDSVLKIDIAALIKKPLKTVNDSSLATVKKINKKKKKYLAAGLTFQKPVGINCDCFYNGSKYTKISSLGDYLPGIYVRLYNKDKWFIQTGFHYAAPQNIKEFTYQTQIQDIPLNYVTTYYSLKKIYYHQVPVSFNYFIYPGWSVGAGVIFNKFSSANIQQDVLKSLYGISEDSVINSKIISSKEDPNFVHIVKNSMQGLVQTEYSWKHFSFGTSYAFGLAPYIEYKSPFSNVPLQRKNNLLSVFIRYQLWDNKNER